MKPKRIKALKAHITAQDRVLDTPYDITEPCYVLRQSDVRALAEQMVDGYWNFYYSPAAAWPKHADSMLYALKRVGITPGRARKGKS